MHYAIARHLAVILATCVCWLSLATCASAGYSYVRQFAPHGTDTYVTSIAVSGNVYLGVDGDVPDRSIQVFDSSGNYYGNIGGAEAPNGVAASPNGDVYLGDGFGGLIGHYSEGGGYLGTINNFPDHENLSFFVSVAADAQGEVWATGGQGTVLHFDGTGQFVSSFPVPGFPSAIAVDPNGSGLIYVAIANSGIGNDGDRILALEPDGSLVGQIGATGTGNGQLRLDVFSGIAIDPFNQLFVSDTLNNRVQIFDATTGQYITQFGTAGTGNGQFNGPAGLGVDGFGNVWVSDTNGHRVQQFTSVPEPSSVALLGLGIAVLAVARHMRRRHVAD